MNRRKPTKKPTAQEILARLRESGNPDGLAGMARYGIATENALGVSVPALRGLARELGKDHALALALWETGVHEARMLAGLVDDPAAVTEEQMEAWACDFDSWDLCDGVCANLFDRTPLAWAKAREWAAREATFTKRAGFALMAALAVHDKKAPDGAFLDLLPLIVREATDERNFVKKAVNWALRQIGKRDRALHAAAIAAAGEIRALDAKAARWIASDALRELESQAVRARLRR